MQPVIVINPLVQTMGWGLVGLMYLGPGTIRLEVMKQGPGTNLLFGRQPMTVKEASTEQPSDHRFDVTVNHVTGTVSGRVVKGQKERIGFGTQRGNRFQSGSCNLVLTPAFEGYQVLLELVGD